MFNELCKTGDCEFVLRIVEQQEEESQFPKLASYNHFRRPFYAHSGNIKTANHVMNVVLGTNNRELLERHIMHFTGPLIAIALREFFLLGNDGSESLNNYILRFHPDGDVPILCRFLNSLGLPDHVLAGIVSQGVEVCAEYGVTLHCPPADVILLVIVWNVFEGAHKPLAKLILGMAGFSSSDEFTWSNATSGLVHFSSAGSRFDRKPVMLMDHPSRDRKVRSRKRYERDWKFATGG